MIGTPWVTYIPCFSCCHMASRVFWFLRYLFSHILQAPVVWGCSRHRIFRFMVTWFKLSYLYSWMRHFRHLNVTCIHRNTDVKFIRCRNNHCLWIRRSARYLGSDTVAMGGFTIPSQTFCDYPLIIVSPPLLSSSLVTVDAITTGLVNSPVFSPSAAQTQPFQWRDWISQSCLPFDY